MTQRGRLFTDLADLPSNLRRCRKANGLTLKAAASWTGLSVSFLSDIERGRTKPSLETLKKLSNAYNTMIDLEIVPDWMTTG